MLMEKRLPLPLHWLSRTAFFCLSAGLIGEAHTDVELFLLERLRGLLREQGYTANEVESVVARGPDRIDLIPELLAAVRAFMKLPEAESLASANKRIDNILKKPTACLHRSRTRCCSNRRSARSETRSVRCGRGRSSFTPRVTIRRCSSRWCR